ncbi:hypothetical protein N0V84_009402 [Fusarium piperis]|uniref:Uncharacterized protein n=1 Tax=Fusarium piperis TaxID=1435070 RepID=A0A9W8W6E5_9HYPO|nr:hypothetical protein N0V84_009402 [Fusarium piperis]
MIGMNCITKAQLNPPTLSRKEYRHLWLQINAAPPDEELALPDSFVCLTVGSTVKAIKSGLDAKDKAAEGLALKLSTALKNTESHVSVAWMGGGQVQDGHSMRDKMLLKGLQKIIDGRDGFEPRMGAKDALDTPMEILLSVRSA